MFRRITVGSLVCVAFSGSGCGYFAPFDAPLPSSAGAAGRDSVNKGASASGAVAGRASGSGGPVSSSQSMSGGRGGTQSTSSGGALGSSGGTAPTDSAVGGTGPTLPTGTNQGGSNASDPTSSGIPASGGLRASGGATDLGGATSLGGTSAAGGVPVAGGNSTSPSTAATGGAATGGAATGGAATGGAATGGAANSFKGGPCVASPDLASIEVIAHGSDRKIYRRAVTESSNGTWASLADLDGTMIDNRSDLDCSAYPNAVHLVALGISPVAGSFLHAYGSGTSYNAFTRVGAGTYDDPSPSITVVWGNTGPNDWRFSINHTIGESAGGTAAVFTGGPMQGPALLSSADVAFMPVYGATYTFMAGLDYQNTLSVHRYKQSAGPAAWLDPPAQLPAPTGTLYADSPAICGGRGGTSGAPGATYVYLFAVAGGKLWGSHATSPAFTSQADFSPWTQVGSDAMSAPECVVTENNVVHVVALSSTGSVLLYEGSPYSSTPWALRLNLGTY